MCGFMLFFAILQFTCAQLNLSTVPVVLWHGMGDSCCNPFSLGAIKRLIEIELPGVYVYSVKFGNTWVEDTLHGFFSDVNQQVKAVCDKLANDTKFSNGYNAVGFSQGSQFLRAVAQRCPLPKMINLVSIGGQHQGVFGYPKCPLGQAACLTISNLLNYAAYTDLVQNHVVQAQYWHDPFNETEYRTKSIFLADINNEKQVNKKYIANLQTLLNFVMVKFVRDTLVVPPETEWFGFYKPGTNDVIQNMNETALYIKDRLGLRTMNELGKLKFLAVDADHLKFNEEWFKKEIILPYLK